MSQEINATNADIVDMAARCPACLQCLDMNSEDICEVDNKVSDDILFVKPKDFSVCKCKVSFGNAFICTCPVRKALYENHKL